MCAKLKLIELMNKVKPICLKSKQFFIKATALCNKLYNDSRKIFDTTGKRLHKMGISANFVSITGFVIGLLAINFLSLENYGLALICILVNRIFDALDGAIARSDKPTDFGVFLDACLDYMF